jgi:hypothetical protein
MMRTRRDMRTDGDRHAGKSLRVRASHGSMGTRAHGTTQRLGDGGWSFGRLEPFKQPFITV